MVSKSKYEIAINNSNVFQANLSTAAISFFADVVSPDDLDESLEDSCTRLAKNLQRVKPKETAAGLKFSMHPDIYADFAKALSETYGIKIFRAESLPFHMRAISARLQNIKALSDGDFEKLYDFVETFDNYVSERQF